MRVSDASMYASANARIMKARSDDVAAGNTVSSGKRIEHPWDDAAGAGIAVRYSQETARQKGIQDATTSASKELGVVDGAMDAITTALSRAKELAVQLSNDTYSASDRQAAVAEVNQLFQGVVSSLNTKFGDRYLFGGQADNAVPFDANGNFVGSATGRQVEIAPGVLSDSSARADVALKGAGGGVDVLQTLRDFSTALTANDSTGIRSAVGNLDVGFNQLSVERSRVGAMMNTFDLASTAAKQSSEASSDAKDAVVNADIFEATTRFAATQSALQATMAAAAQSFKLTLLDKL